MFDSRTVANILKIPLANNQNVDKVIWVQSKKGDYTVKSAYNTLMFHAEPQSGPLSSEEWKLLWKLNVQERLKLFLWKAVWQIIPTRTRLARVIAIPEEHRLCPLCSTNPETTELSWAVPSRGSSGGNHHGRWTPWCLPSSHSLTGCGSLLIHRWG